MRFQRFHVLEAVVRRCSVRKVFLEISQNSQENTCARVSFLIKLQASIPDEEKNISEIFIFTSPWCLERFYEGL